MSFYIIIKDGKGKDKKFMINPDEKILDAKNRGGFSSHIWKSNGEVLKDAKTFNDYGIEEEDVIVSNLPNPGGKFIIYIKLF